ncbi:hypothetical protein GCM10022205_32990 [Spinactinospora alkalitolerans]
MEATVIADERGRTLWTDALRPGRMHGATAARLTGIAACFCHFLQVEVLLDDGYLGLRRDHPTRRSHHRANPTRGLSSTTPASSTTGSASGRTTTTTIAPPTAHSVGRLLRTPQAETPAPGAARLRQMHT